MMKKNVNKVVLPPNNAPTMAQAVKADFLKNGDAGFTYAALVGDSLVSRLSWEVEIVSGTALSSPHWVLEEAFTHK